VGHVVTTVGKQLTVPVLEDVDLQEQYAGNVSFEDAT
jgi:hypothetical protein